MPERPRSERSSAVATSTSPSYAGSRRLTSKPAATVRVPRELQASAKALSASAATRPPCATAYPLTMSGRTVIDTTARPSRRSSSSMPMARLAGSSAHICRAVSTGSTGSGIEVHGEAVADRVGLAGQHEARFDLGGLECVVATHVDLAVGDSGPAGAAHPALAREREVGPHRLATVEDARVPGQRGRRAQAVEDDGHLGRLAGGRGLGPAQLGRRLVDVEELEVDAVPGYAELGQHRLGVDQHR